MSAFRGRLSKIELLLQPPERVKAVVMLWRRDNEALDDFNARAEADPDAIVLEWI